jgi:hypothetical protein
VSEKRMVKHAKGKTKEVSSGAFVRKKRSRVCGLRRRQLCRKGSLKVKFSLKWVLMFEENSCKKKLSPSLIYFHNHNRWKNPRLALFYADGIRNYPTQTYEGKKYV